MNYAIFLTIFLKCICYTYSHRGISYEKDTRIN